MVYQRMYRPLKRLFLTHLLFLSHTMPRTWYSSASCSNYDVFAVLILSRARARVCEASFNLRRDISRPISISIRYINNMRARADVSGAEINFSRRMTSETERDENRPSSCFRAVYNIRGEHVRVRVRSNARGCKMKVKIKAWALWLL